jgi:hypothetical protein
VNGLKSPFVSHCDVHTRRAGACTTLRKTKLWNVVAQSMPQRRAMTLTGLHPSSIRPTSSGFCARTLTLALNNLHHDNSFAPSSTPTSNCRPRPRWIQQKHTHAALQCGADYPGFTLPNRPMLQAPGSRLPLWDAYSCTLSGLATQKTYSVAARLLRAHTHAEIALRSLPDGFSPTLHVLAQPAALCFRRLARLHVVERLSCDTTARPPYARMPSTPGFDASCFRCFSAP